MPSPVEKAFLKVRDRQTTELSLEALSIGDSGLEPIAQRIINQSLQITKLNLNANTLTSSSLPTLAKLINSLDGQLQTLDLNSNPDLFQDAQIDPQAFQLHLLNFIEAISGTRTLRKLHLSLNAITDEIALALIEAISKTYIVVCDLSLNPSVKPNTLALLDQTLKTNARKSVNSRVTIEVINDDHSEKINVKTTSQEEKPTPSNDWMSKESSEETTRSQAFSTEEPEFDEYPSESPHELYERAMEKRKRQKIKLELLLTLEQHYSTNQSRFYLRLESRFKSFFTACLNAASDFIVVDNKTNVAGKIGLVMQLLAPLGNLLPLLGPFFTTAISAAGAAVSNADQQRQTQRLKNIAKCLTQENIDIISKEIAFRLTERFQDQLVVLPSRAQPVNLIIAGLDALAIRLGSEQYLAIRLAEQIFHHIIEVVVQDERVVFNEETFIRDLLRAFDHSTSLIEEALKKLDKVGRENDFIVKTGKPWSFKHILLKPSIQTPSLDIYESPKEGFTDEHTYGRQYADRETAEFLGFVLKKQAQYVMQPPTQRLAFNIDRIATAKISGKSQLLLAGTQLNAALQSTQTQQLEYHSKTTTRFFRNTEELSPLPQLRIASSSSSSSSSNSTMSVESALAFTSDEDLASRVKTLESKLETAEDNLDMTKGRLFDAEKKLSVAEGKIAELTTSHAALFASQETLLLMLAQQNTFMEEQKRMMEQMQRNQQEAQERIKALETAKQPESSRKGFWN